MVLRKMGANVLIKIVAGVSRSQEALFFMGVGYLWMKESSSVKY